jgi:hypothetical protein
MKSSTYRDKNKTYNEELKRAEELRIAFEQAKAALENGQVVIALVNGDSMFTTGGHFIVLTGLTDDGKVLVNDPNGNNYKRFPDKFENGFKPSEIYKGAVAYWIYGKKEVAPQETLQSAPIKYKDQMQLLEIAYNEFIMMDNMSLCLVKV